MVGKCVSPSELVSLTIVFHVFGDVMCTLCRTAPLVSFTFCGSGNKISFDKNKLGGLC